MIKRYCDKCGRELSADEDYQIPVWWTITRHGALDITLELCDQCFVKTKTQNSNLTFEKRTMRDCYNCKRYEAEGECVECHFEPKDEPQTEREGE